MFDNLRDQAAVITNDPSVAGRIRHIGTEYGDGVAGVLMFRHEGSKCFGGQKRYVTVGYDNGAGY